MSSFWLIIKQQWTIEEISIFSNSSHLEWKAELSDTILKWDYPRTIAAKCGLIWFSGFREEDLNVIVYQNMTNLHNLHKSAEQKFHRKTRIIFQIIDPIFSSLSTPCSGSSVKWVVLKYKTKSKRNETKRNETKRNETKRNEINRNEIDRNGTKRNNSKWNNTYFNETIPWGNTRQKLNEKNRESII